VFQRFRRWVRAGLFERIFERLSGEPDFEYARIDGTIVTAHQKASGAKGGLSIRPSGARAAG
jgi:transposase